MEDETGTIVYTKEFESYEPGKPESLRSRAERLLRRNHLDQALGLYQELLRGYEHLLNLKQEEDVGSEITELAGNEIDRHTFNFGNGANLVSGQLSRYHHSSNGEKYATLHLRIDYLKLEDLCHELPGWVHHFTSETLVFGCRSNHPVYHQESGQEGLLVDRLS